MQPFTQLTSIAIPLDLRHVDTDAIIPARFLRLPRSDYGKSVFNDLRLDGDGNKLDFPFNKSEYYKAQILVADENFGCGSSREAAVWALAEHDGTVLETGLRCVIAPSFGDIFYNNCTKNGVLPIRLPEEACADLRKQLHGDVGATVSVDLVAQKVVFPGGEEHSFEIDPNRKHCLVNGLDDVAVTQQYAADIDSYEERMRAERPWALTRQ